MPATGRSAPASAGSGRGGGAAPVQSRPSQHADPERQFEGLLRGLGVSSKEPTCSKRSSSLGKLHGATHFAIGCQKWDDGARGASTAHTAFVDPQVVYATCDAPDKNSSQVELQQVGFDPAVHYRTEQRERFFDPGPQPRDGQLRVDSTVHLGDDRPELVTQTKGVHSRMPEEELQRAKQLRAAGAGTLIPTSLWPKPVRCHPVTAGPRSLDNYDLGVASGVQFGRITQNSSSIVTEAHVRNPVLGHCVPLAAMPAKGPTRATADIVAEANATVPHLRSLGALRPHQ